mmetsp:Transcript_17347/g.16816  ORF Transcript_17347/g.16816 Transcript_17347/m.16816 type:complete len:293 (-) Transcript_17347:595-1473(-)
MIDDVQHDQLPSPEEVKTDLSAYSYQNQRSLFRYKIISSLLLMTTVILSIALGVISNKNHGSANVETLDSSKIEDVKTLDPSIIEDVKTLDPSKMEDVIRDAILNKGIAASTASGYQFNPRSVQRRALNMVMKENSLTVQLVIQRYALWCLYFATEHVGTSVTDAVFGFGTVPHWLDGWTNDGPDPCLWHGVRCKSDGIVVELNLGLSSITGILPAELKLLDSLSTLDLHDNFGLGEGGVPSWLKDFDSLKLIDLRGCSFSGNVAEELCDSIDFLYADCSGINFNCSCCNTC